MRARRVTTSNEVDRRTAGAVRLKERAVRFRRAVWAYYRMHGRHDLLWRRTTDPYRILVSEMMLQQTQVPRVIPKYRSFIKRFPTVRRLAQASLADVLKEWSGLGYNRRGKFLHDAAKEVVGRYGGRVPQDAPALRALSGVGEYTASAVRAFAFNKRVAMLETNIRTALIHHFHTTEDGPLGKVGDKGLTELMAKIVEVEKRPREFYWALMDYGAHLKASGVRNNIRSKHYAKQSRFEGSLRQVRGEILRQLSNGGPSSAICRGRSSARMREALSGLERDGLIKKEKGKWHIA